MALLRYLPFIGLLAERDQSREIMSLPTILILHATSIVATTTAPPLAEGRGGVTYTHLCICFVMDGFSSNTSY